MECDYTEELRGALEAKGLVPEEVWRAEMFMELAAIRSLAADSCAAIADSRRRVGTLCDLVQSIVAPGEVAEARCVSRALNIHLRWRCNV